MFYLINFHDVLVSSRDWGVLWVLNGHLQQYFRYIVVVSRHSQLSWNVICKRVLALPMTFLHTSFWLSTHRATKDDSFNICCKIPPSVQFKQQTVEKFRRKLWWNVNISWMWIQCWIPTALKCTGSGERWPHWVVFCRSLCFLLVIVLSVLLRFAASDYRFGKITKE